MDENERLGCVCNGCEELLELPPAQIRQVLFDDLRGVSIPRLVSL